ncbi:hypothetical protein L198_01536 [Cryptococcus wingfieldii CBS 7118]|uniref:Uncharacterized protein n=1 Tax=Cryptococcus wingfieldii CBS 7118 TaxID=1295528 RepID=A0A1E3JZK8_9TREE|nr:hypothetical protein L198_01536 [Cryptococcus wingfieldii CBS 7118]ODO06304.1 hypothetical protein L198_01536 [Cryptococcus wingfieldii CBS 7118]
MNEDQESENEGRGGDLVIDDEPRGEDVEDDIEQRSQQMSSQGLRHGVSGGNLLVAGDERGNVSVMVSKTSKTSLTRLSETPPSHPILKCSTAHHPRSAKLPALSTLPDANDSDAEDERAGEVVPGDEEMKTKPPATRIKVVMVKVMVGMEAVETKAMTLASGYTVDDQTARERLMLYNWKVQNNVTRKAFDNLPLPSMSGYSSKRAAADLDSLLPAKRFSDDRLTMKYDRCPANHISYTGPHSEKEECPKCKAPRKINGKASAQWEYILLKPRLQLLFHHPQRNEHEIGLSIFSKKTICFGQLLNVITVELPSHPSTPQDGPPKTFILAHLRRAATTKQKIGTRQWYWYEGFAAEELVDLGSVNELVGRVKSLRKPRRIYIIDRGTEASRVDIVM